MGSRLYFEIGAIVLLTIAQGFFALSEFSVIASRRVRLRQQAEQKKFGSVRALKLNENPETFLASIQVGITLLNSLIGVFSGATIADYLQTWFAASSIELVARWSNMLAVAIVVISVTTLAVIVGELVPKYIALSFPEKWARVVSTPITYFIKVTYVFTRSLSLVAKGIVKSLGIRSDKTRDVVSEEEIEHMIIEGRQKGFFELSEEQFVRSVFDFTDTSVRRAMKPRPDVIAIEIDTPPAEILATISEHGYSRYPIYDDSIDKIIGVIYVKDLLKPDSDLQKIDLRKILRQPFFVPESMQLNFLLREFQGGKNHMAIVIDEYGGTAGIITLEDILEELVGEIQDEYDSEAAPLVKHNETIVYANGSVWPGEVNELIATHLPEDESDTLAGLFIDSVGHVPEKNETVQVGDARMTVLAKSRHRILRMKIERIETAAERRRQSDFTAYLRLVSLAIGESLCEFVFWRCRNKLIHFVNVPASCIIRICTLDGDLVRAIKHEVDLSDPNSHHETWDMINRNIQTVVSGLYYWKVEGEGKVQVGKLVIIR